MNWVSCLLLFMAVMLGYTHYGSTNETYKIAYGKQALASRLGRDELRQMCELLCFEAQAHCVPFLRILPRNESHRYGKKDRKETEESKGETKRGKIIGTPSTRAKLGAGQDAVLCFIESFMNIVIISK